MDDVHRGASAEVLLAYELERANALEGRVGRAYVGWLLVEKQAARQTMW